MKNRSSVKLSNMAFQVVDVHKPLLSVASIAKQGHKAMLSNDESYIELAGGGRLPLCEKDGVSELEVPVRSPEFARPNTKQ